MTAIATGICDGCGRRKRVDAGRIVGHMLAIDVSRRAITSVGAGRVRRRCPGSGRPAEAGTGD